MLRVVFLALALVASCSLAAENHEYVTTDTQDLTEECDGKCVGNLNKQVEDLQTLVSKLNLKKIVLKNVMGGICEECKVAGFHKFGVPNLTCKKESAQNLIDHSFDVSFEQFTFECKCKMNSNPGITAEMLNKVQSPSSSCFQNTHAYGKFMCDDNGSDKEVNVEIVGDLGSAVFPARLRANTEEKTAFPVFTEGQLEGSYTFKVLDGGNDEDIKDTADCLQNKNVMDQLFLERLVVEIQTIFCTCMTGEKPGKGMFDRVMYNAASCTST